MDHHCPFISACVGRRNYIWFFAFICTLWLNSLFVVIVTAIDFDRRIGLVEFRLILMESFFDQNVVP